MEIMNVYRYIKVLFKYNIPYSKGNEHSIEYPATLAYGVIWCYIICNYNDLILHNKFMFDVVGHEGSIYIQ